MSAYVPLRIHNAVAASGVGTAFNVLGFTNIAVQVLSGGNPNGIYSVEGSFSESADEWYPVPLWDHEGVEAQSASFFGGGIFHLRPNGVRRARVRWIRTGGTLTAWVGMFRARGRGGMGYYSEETLHNGTDETGTGTPLNVRGMRGVTVALVDEGDPEGTVTWMGTVNDTNWEPIALRKSDGSMSDEADGLNDKGSAFTLPEYHGISQLRADVNYTSGAFTIRSGKQPL